MSGPGYLQVIVIAAVAQLAVLPGEKVQFIIAGLSTRYRPAVVVAAAGTAFAGWTAVEIAFGAAVQEALSPSLLDAFTAAMFLLFAVLLVRSAPAADAAPAAAAETDGGSALAPDVAGEVTLFGHEFSGVLGSYLSIFAMMAAGEFGDKTQLVTISLAAQYGATSAIWAGEMLAIVPVSLANAYFFHRFSGRFDARKAHIAGAALFLFFGLDTLLSMATGFSVWETLVGTVSGAVVGLLAP